MTGAELLTWVALVFIGYINVGYPVLIALLAKLFRKPHQQKTITPSVTLIISAFNEEQVIEKKIENSLQLTYPKQQLEIIIVSDASTDRTDEIVRKCQSEQVKLLRLPQRGGKTVGLNEAVKVSQGDILVFSDANIMYKQDVIANLVQNFYDPSVGCATGDARYQVENESSSGTLERNYWAIEQIIRESESHLGSTVGGDGAIFAIKKSLYSPLPPDAINDFLTPLQIVSKKFRAIYEPTAIGVEPASGSLWGEFRRKRRIVNRSWWAFSHCPDPLLPWRVGLLFSWQVWSHKVLRWLTLVFIVTAVTGSFFAYDQGLFYRLILWSFVGSLVLASVGAVIPERSGKTNPLLHGALYFYLVNLGAVLGIMSALLGNIETIWVPERSEGDVVQRSDETS